MNYYIQGNAAKAKQIKAAFEAKGYEKGNVLHIGDYENERLFFFTVDGKVRSTLKDCGIVHIIKTHPDYKELELPVEPKFKVGDKISWINHDCDTQTITDIRDDSYITVDKYGVRCALKFVNQDKWELVPKPHINEHYYGGLIMTKQEFIELRQRLDDFNIEVGTAMTIDWQQVRIQAAIEFAAQILGNLGGAPTSVAKDAVDYADALIEELKKGGKDDNNH